MATRGQDQCGHILAGLPHLRYHVKTADPGQHDIQDHDVEGGRFGLQPFKRGFAGVHQLHLIAFRFQVESQSFSEVLLVFNYQHSVHFVVLAHLLNFTIGSCRMKVLPRPGPSLSAQARPP